MSADEESTSPDDAPEPVLVDHRALAPETLRALVEDFVTRDGTDYGESEVPVASRVRRVMTQLDRGEAVVTFDPASETVTLLPANDPRVSASKRRR